MNGVNICMEHSETNTMNLLLTRGKNSVVEKELAPTVARNQAVCFSIRKSVGLNNRVDGREG
jgi:hypothetical protein